MEQEREGKRVDKRPRQVDQQGTIDSWDLCWCQSEGQTGSQLWFVPVTLLTLFNLGFGQLTAQTTSVHSHRKLGNPRLHGCSESLSSEAIEMHYMAKCLQTQAVFSTFSASQFAAITFFFLYNSTRCRHWFDCPSQGSVVQYSIIPYIKPLNNSNLP